jgi:hypothetical protein
MECNVSGWFVRILANSATSVFKKSFDIYPDVNEIKWRGENWNDRIIPSHVLFLSALSPKFTPLPLHPHCPLWLICSRFIRTIPYSSSAPASSALSLMVLLLPLHPHYPLYFLCSRFIRIVPFCSSAPASSAVSLMVPLLPLHPHYSL